MCNLNILINLKNQSILNCSFLTGATAVSYNDSNGDGDGIYFDNGILIRSKDKLNLFNYLDAFNSSKLMLTHQRYSTSGKTEKYTQPFEDSHFVMAHNGVLSNYVEGNKSDTFVVFAEFLKLFNKSKAKRETRIIKSIETLFKDEHGTWSISLFDKETKTLYYFKDSSTSIACYINKKRDILFLTTKEDNNIFLHVFNDSFKQVEIEDYILYKITFKAKIKIKKLKKLEKQRYSYEKYKKSKAKKDLDEPWYLQDTNVDKPTSKKERKRKKQFKKHVLTKALREPCENCQEQTEYEIEYSGYRVCRDCFHYNYVQIVKEARYNRDIQNKKIEPSVKEFLKRTKGREI